MHLIRRILYVAVASALLLELALQAGALGTYLLHRREGAVLAMASTGGETLRVLCVGDSFTYGVGASTPQHSYPSMLERYLEERHGLEATVTNAGWPAQDSGDVIASLEDHLRRSRAQIVCVLVGVNDLWNRPRPFDGSQAVEAPGGFRLRWRTGRLFLWLFHDRHEGSWSRTGEDESPPTDAMVTVARSLIGEAGIRPIAEPRWLDRPAAVRDVERAVWPLLQSQQSAKALELLEAALRAHDDPRLHALRVRALTVHGDRDGALAALDSMRARYRRGESIEEAIALLHALWSAGASEETFELAQAVVERAPENGEAWQLLAQAATNRDPELAKKAYRRHLETSGPARPWITSSASALGRLLAESDPVNGARLLQAGLLLQGTLQRHAFACYLLAGKRFIPAETMRASLEPPGLDERGRSLLRAAYEQTYGEGGTEWRQVLEQHLEEIAAMVRSHGAKPVFATYPSCVAAEPILQAAASAARASLVDVRQRFDRELQELSREDLFIPDGHCNDAGYAIVAEEIAKEVARLAR